MREEVAEIEMGIDDEVRRPGKAKFDLGVQRIRGGTIAVSLKAQTERDGGHELCIASSGKNCEPDR